MLPVASLGLGPLPLTGPPPPIEGGDDNLVRSHRSQRSPHSPVTFFDGCSHPLPSVEDFVSFGQEGEEDFMSISASEEEEWAESERDCSGSEGCHGLRADGDKAHCPGDDWSQSSNVLRKLKSMPRP